MLRNKTSNKIYVFLYYIHFEITGDPSNLTGSQQCDNQSDFKVFFYFTNHIAGFILFK